jgi:hypothetical protein
MAKVQKTYTREFKEEAVRLVQTSGKPIVTITQICGGPKNDYLTACANACS